MISFNWNINQQPSLKGNNNFTSVPYILGLYNYHRSGWITLLTYYLVQLWKSSYINICQLFVYSREIYILFYSILYLDGLLLVLEYGLDVLHRVLVQGILLRPGEHGGLRLQPHLQQAEVEAGLYIRVCQQENVLTNGHAAPHPVLV